MRRTYKESGFNSDIVRRIKEIKAEHPFWGYRRVHATLKYVYGLDINEKRVYRLMKKHDLLVNKDTKLKAIRTPTKSKPHPTEPNKWWGIDMTKALTLSGWVYIVIVLDWYTKKAVGYHIGERATATDWKVALDMAVNRQFPCGSRGEGLNLMSDNGCQPTSISFMTACKILDVKQAFTSYNNPKGNADTERFMRTMKEEKLWLSEWTSPNDVKKELTKWLEKYNRSYLHSTLGYKAPERFELEHKNNHSTTFKVA